MAISSFTFACVGANYDRKGRAEMRLPHKMSSYIDLAVGLALIAVALLGMYRVIPMATNTTTILLCVGGTYAGIMVLTILTHLKLHSEATHDIFMCRGEKQSNEKQSKK